MKIAYLLTTYPSRTETFAAREISGLRRSGVAIFILAAKADASLSTDSHLQCVCYRPDRYSLAHLAELTYLIRKYPLGLIHLINLIVRLAFHSPAESVRILLNLSAIAHFILLLDREKIYHLHAYFFSWPATMALAISCISKRSFSITGHARDIFVDSGAMKLKVSSASFVTTCSRYGLTFLQNHLPADWYHKLHLCYHGLDRDDLALFAPNANANANAKKSTPPHLLAVARLVPKKGLPVLLHAFEQVRNSYPEAQLIILGDGPQRRFLQQLTERLGISASVKFPGHLPHHQLHSFYHRASALIVPSVQTGEMDCDGIPNVILEAFAAHLPVIATSVGGITEAVIHQQTGLLVAPDSPDELARMILTLLDDRALQKSLTKHAASALAEKFNLERNLRPLVDLFQEMNFRRF